jgi:ABC-type multidrug transport system ATPase subunit
VAQPSGSERIEQVLQVTSCARDSLDGPVPFAAVVSGTNLSRRYGLKRVFQKVDVQIDAGGFLLVTGPNGSGKTTFLRMLAGLDAPSGGELELPDRGVIGYLGHEPLVYRELTPLENLHLFGRLYRIPERGERIGMLLERFGLWDVRDQLVSTFSRGMRQRLGLCRVLLHDPELVILDEPFNALDDAGSTLLDATLDELRGTRSFVVATHDPARVARLATQRLAFT